MGVVVHEQNGLEKEIKRGHFPELTTWDVTK